MTQPDNETICRLRGVSKSFGATRVLTGLDLDIQRRRTTVIIGPSGCGKSVLLKHMIGLIRPNRGKVFFKDIEISSLGPAAMAGVRRQMGFLFQGGALFDSMTVAQNICFPAEQHNVGDPEQRIGRCREVLAAVGLEGFEDRMPESLSGGQKKRIALARAIVLKPEIIFYDEPTTGLDPIRADLINELIVRLHRQLGTTSVVVTHDIASARRIGDRILMLDGGRFIADTTPDRMDQVENESFSRFVRGQAELGRLDAEPSTSSDTEKARP